MSQPRPATELLTDADRATILALHAAGKSRNDIAREVQRSGSTVTKVVHQAGLTFDRTATEAATRARRADFRAVRAELSEKLLNDALLLREQIWEPHEYIEHGGKDFLEARWHQDEPAPVDKLKLMQATASAIGRHLDIERHDAEDGASDARAMLLELGRALGVKGPEQ